MRRAAPLSMMMLVACAAPAAPSAVSQREAPVLVADLAGDTGTARFRRRSAPARRVPDGRRVDAAGRPGGDRVRAALARGRGVGGSGGAPLRGPARRCAPHAGRGRQRDPRAHAARRAALRGAARRPRSAARARRRPGAHRGLRPGVDRAPAGGGDARLLRRRPLGRRERRVDRLARARRRALPDQLRSRRPAPTGDRASSRRPRRRTIFRSRARCCAGGARTGLRTRSPSRRRGDAPGHRHDRRRVALRSTTRSSA